MNISHNEHKRIGCLGAAWVQVWTLGTDFPLCLPGPDPSETLPTAIWPPKATRSGALERARLCGVLPRSREWGLGAPSFPGERAAAGRVLTSQQFRYGGSSAGLMCPGCKPPVAASPLLAEGGLWERSLTALQMERGMQLPEPSSDLELRGTRPSGLTYYRVAQASVS